MAKTSPEKLAQALRANLKRRKGPQVPKDGCAAKHAPDAAAAKVPPKDPKPAKKPGFP